jgi:hypothetical protein
MIELIRYYGQIQFGLTFTRHDHGAGKHCHIWIDLGGCCIEVIFGRRRKSAEKWFSNLLKFYKNDPEFILEGIIFDLTERLARIKKVGK